MSGHRGRADHARHHPHSGLPLLLTLTGIAPVSPPAVTIATPRRSNCRTGRRVRGGSAVAAAAEISGELDVRRDDRIKRAARHRRDRGRPAGVGPRNCADRHRRADRYPVRAHEDEDPAEPCQCGAGIVRDRDRDLGHLRRSDRDDHACRFADIIVAFAPGAMDAMLALALTLHIDPISSARTIYHDLYSSPSQRQASSICSDDRRKTSTIIPEVGTGFPSGQRTFARRSCPTKG